MDERMFGLGEYERMDASATELGSDLAERIAEQISHAGHDWKLIAQDAQLLANLATRMVELQHPGQADPPTPEAGGSEPAHP